MWQQRASVMLSVMHAPSRQRETLRQKQTDLRERSRLLHFAWCAPCDSCPTPTDLKGETLTWRPRGGIGSSRARLSTQDGTVARSMSTAFSFQTQLLSIMDALSRAAVAEISKLVEIESKMLKIEITRGRNEIASLTEKLQLMEKLLRMAQGSHQEATTAAAACLAAGRAAEDGALESERTRTVKKRCVWST